MNRNMIIAMVALSLLLLGAGCKQQTFDGSRSSNESMFKLDFKVLNETKTHEMDLAAGTAIHVEIVKESGRLDIHVTDAQGDVIYQGNDAASSSFDVAAPVSGTYKFSVKGENARGSVYFTVDS